MESFSVLCKTDKFVTVEAVFKNYAKISLLIKSNQEKIKIKYSLVCRLVVIVFTLYQILSFCIPKIL